MKWACNGCVWSSYSDPSSSNLRKLLDGCFKLEHNVTVNLQKKFSFVQL